MGSLPHVVEDCEGILQLYSDGSINRSDINLDNFLNNVNPLNDVVSSAVLWKDFLFHKPHHLHLRLYKPKQNPPSSSSSLPVLLFLHGGGFCVGSRSWPNFHNYCLRLSSALQAVVVSPDYRLAPEHRLPAPIDDAISAVEWVRAQATCENPDPWLGSGVMDFGRVFVLGDSSGGNIAHHLAVRFGSGFDDLGPLRVRGFVLMAPFFGGSLRTKSEAEGPPEPLLNLEILENGIRVPPQGVGDMLKFHLESPEYKMTLPVEPRFSVPLSQSVSVSVLVGRKDSDRVARIINKSNFDYVDRTAYRALAFDYLDFSPCYPFVSGIRAWVSLLFMDCGNEGVIDVFGIEMDFCDAANSKEEVLWLLDMLDWK